MPSFSAISSQRAHGAIVGATIMAGFGAVWIVFGLLSAGITLRVGLLAVLPVFILFVALGCLMRRRLPRPVKLDGLTERSRSCAFAAINIVQWLAIIGTVHLLRVFHLEAWTIAAIVLIVGVHFLPLAQLFGTRCHLQTGVALILCAVAALWLPAAARDTVECLAAGLILWFSAGRAIRAAFRMLPVARLVERTGVQA